MIDFDKFRPILIVPTIPYNNGIRFLCINEKLDLNGEIVNTLWKIFAHCDGYNTFNEIVEKTELDENIVKNLLIQLVNKRIISDSSKQYQHFHEISNYPAKYKSLLTEEEIIEFTKSKRKSVKKGKRIKLEINKKSNLYKLELNRKSCRNFSKDKKIKLSDLSNICINSYSLVHHSTPSGGGLYPLKIYVIVTNDQEDFKAGYYEFDNEKNELVLYNKYPDIDQLKYCFNDERLAFNSSIQIIIAADLDRQPVKYSNRGYRLTLIEVGHVAENISLCCEEIGLRSCELGGVLDNSLAKELDIDKENISPILAVSIGYESKEEFFRYDKFLSKLSKLYVGKDNIIENFGVNNLNYEDASFYGAWSRYVTKKEKGYSGATGYSYNEATCKAIIEGYERYRSSIVKVDYIGPAQNNGKFYKPEEIVPLTDEQREYLKLPKYKDGDTIEWTKDMSGEYYFPTDFVYYGHGKKDKLFYSDSSGIAAYSTYDEAKIRAVNELIERDAIMRNWYSKISPKHVSEKMLSTHIKNRINHWKNKNREVHILSLDSKYLPVFLVVIVSDTYPCFVSGACASINGIEKSILKAYEEAEFNLLMSLSNPVSNFKDRKDIKTPKEHGEYYHFKENKDKIKWIWSNNETVYIKDKKVDTSKIINKLDAKFIDLSGSKNDILKVVRAVSRKVVPISFGYNRDYYTHPELKNIEIKNRDLPHYFA